MKATDIITICSAIVAFGSAVTAPQLEAVFPGKGSYISGVISLGSLVAGVIIRVLTNKTDAPAKAIAADAVVVPSGTPVFNQDTEVKGINVSTTSTAPIAAPQKGNPT